MDIEETVEDLEDQLQKTLKDIENLAAKVAEENMDAYEGFMKSEEHKDKLEEIGNKLKEKGVDINTLME
jgi:hypothetical protein